MCILFDIYIRILLRCTDPWTLKTLNHLSLHFMLHKRTSRINFYWTVINYVCQYFLYFVEIEQKHWTLYIKICLFTHTPGAQLHSIWMRTKCLEFCTSEWDMQVISHIYLLQNNPSQWYVLYKIYISSVLSAMYLKKKSLILNSSLAQSTDYIQLLQSETNSAQQHLM